MVGGSTGCLDQVITETFEVVQRSEYAAAREWLFLQLMSTNHFLHPPLTNHASLTSHAQVKCRVSPRAHAHYQISLD